MTVVMRCRPCCRPRKSTLRPTHSRVPVSVSCAPTADLDEGGRIAHHRRNARAGCRGTGARYASADETQEDDDDGEIDGDDLKPHFESPPWLGPLEAFDLGGGGSINPSINRYLREFQREGVRTTSHGGKVYRCSARVGLFACLLCSTAIFAVLYCFIAL